MGSMSMKSEPNTAFVIRTVEEPRMFVQTTYDSAVGVSSYERVETVTEATFYTDRDTAEYVADRMMRHGIHALVTPVTIMVVE
jgi:hypothetical protein